MKIAACILYLASLVLVSSITSTTAQAGIYVYTMNFDSAPTVDNSVRDSYSPDFVDIWYPDRYLPAGFTSVAFDGDNRLQLSISAADGQGTRATFPSSTYHNTQGYTYNTPGGVSFSVDLYLDSAWQSLDNEMRVGLWGDARNEANLTQQIDFPILSFGSVGGDGFQFRISDETNGWQEIGTFDANGAPGDLAWDTWYNLQIDFDAQNGEYDFLINGTSVHTSIALNGVTELNRLFLQGYNGGESYDVHWDNLSITSTIAPVPEPATYGLLAGVIALGLVVMRRRSRRSLESPLALWAAKSK